MSAMLIVAPPPPGRAGPGGDGSGPEIATTPALPSWGGVGGRRGKGPGGGSGGGGGEHNEEGGGEGELGRSREGKGGEGEGCYLDSIGRLFESDQHIPVSSAGRVPGTELRARVGTGGREREAEKRGYQWQKGRWPPPQYRTRRATPPPTPHPRTLSSPTWARPGGARSQRPPARSLARPPARPRGGGGVPAPAAPAVAPPPPLRPAPRGPPGRGRHRGWVSRYLHEGLYRAFGRVQVGGAQMAALVHRGRRVYQEQ